MKILDIPNVVADSLNTLKFKQMINLTVLVCNIIRFFVIYLREIS